MPENNAAVMPEIIMGENDVLVIRVYRDGQSLAIHSKTAPAGLDDAAFVAAFAAALAGIADAIDSMDTANGGGHKYQSAVAYAYAKSRTTRMQTKAAIIDHGNPN